jgi:hypothetical protein
MSLINLNTLNLSPAAPSFASAVAKDAFNSPSIQAPALSPSPTPATTFTPTPTTAGTPLTYDLPTAIPLSPMAVWGSTNNSDPVSLVMGANVGGDALSARFTGLGAALLARFNTTSADFAQSVWIAPIGNGPVASQPAISAAVALDVTTVSGIKVELDIKNGGDGTLAVKVHGGANLSDAEKTALANLANGFQGALDGLTAYPPGVALSGLIQIDPTVLSSIDLHVQLQSESAFPTTLDFQVDSAHRSIDLNMPIRGAVKINVNLSNTSMVGTQEQQNAAIHNYLQQLNQEEARDPGGEDTGLMQAFTDSFTQINSHYPSTLAPSFATGPSIHNDQDHAMLTGLADFQASVAQTPSAPNPYKPDEVDRFTYQVSQQTTVSGHNNADRMITQQQSASLNASYHKWFTPPPSPLMASKKRRLQNYFYEQINDSAGVTSNIGYQKGGLSQASINKSASQSTHATKFEYAEKIADTTVTAADTATVDLMALLKPLQTEDPKDADKRKQVLAEINAQVYLQSDPTALGQLG